jgi:purine-binding chemotaxis protein CheW
MAMAGDNQTLDVLCFTFNHIAACIELSSIEKILPLPAIKKIPDAASYIVGLINYEGKTVPVIDLAFYFKQQRQTPYDLSAAILLCQVQGQRLALLVDSVEELLVLNQNAIEKLRQPQDKLQVIYATAIIADKVCLCLDINKLLLMSNMMSLST